MKCNEFEILISDYLDGIISPVEKNEFEEHVRTCDNCRNELSETMKLLEKVSALPKNVYPEHDLWNNVEARIVPTKPVDLPPGKDSENKIFSINKSEDIEKYRAIKTNRMYRYAVISAIAAILLIAFLPSLLKHKISIEQIQNSIGPTWKVTRTMGITLLASNNIESTGFMKQGDVLETKDSSGAVVEVDSLGTITLEPNTKIQFVKSDSSEKRISVIYGSVHANINAKPKTFYVDTKSATAIDMGCSYNLTVDTTGDAILYVDKGSVILSSNGRESIVPEGKYCMSKSGIGPGTPYRKNASQEFKDALLKYDFGNGGSEAINTLLKHAKKTDAVTLINILPRCEGASRGKVYDRLKVIAPPPVNFNYDSIPHMNIDDLHEWIEKLQKEIHEQVQMKIQELQKELKDKLPGQIQKEFGNDYYSPELEDRIMEGVEKGLEGLDKLKDLKGLENLNELEGLDTISQNKYWDSEKFNKQMEMMNKELEKNNEQIEKNMDKLQEKMEKFNEDYQGKWQEKQQEMNEKMREKEERMRERMQEKEQDRLEKEEENKQKEEMNREQERMNREQEMKNEEQEKMNREHENNNSVPKTDDNQKDNNKDGDGKY